MVVVRVWGGLGNQMFQYALGYAMAKRNNTELVLDMSFFYQKHNSWTTERTPDLLELPIDKCKLVNRNNEISPLLHILQNPYVNYAIRRILPIAFPIGKYTYVKESKLEFLPSIIKMKGKNVYFDGYWHCDQYFDSYRGDLQKQFVAKEPLILNYYNEHKQGKVNTVAVHIRRGDYVSQNNPNVRGIEYYLKAMDYIKEKIDNPLFYIFSDDLDWVVKQFGKREDIVLVNKEKTLTDIQEFQMISLCDHQIISNSSYSWWGAWLNDNPKKIVICPAKWEGKKDMMLDEWVKI